jgi:hypothetical protein
MRFVLDEQDEDALPMARKLLDLMKAFYSPPVERDDDCKS